MGDFRKSTSNEDKWQDKCQGSSNLCGSKNIPQVCRAKTSGCSNFDLSNRILSENLLDVYLGQARRIMDYIVQTSNFVQKINFELYCLNIDTSFKHHLHLKTMLINVSDTAVVTPGFVFLCTICKAENPDEKVLDKWTPLSLKFINWLRKELRKNVHTIKINYTRSFSEKLENLVLINQKE